MVKLLIISWVIFFLAESFLGDIKKNKFLKKTCFWVFLPFLSEYSKVIRLDNIFLIVFFMMIICAISFKRKSIASKFCFVAISVVSVETIVNSTKLGNEAFKYLFS